MIRRLLARLRAGLVAEDPNPLPSRLDLIGGTYDIVHAAVQRAVYRASNDTTSVLPGVIDRIAREVTTSLDAQPGEHGDLDALRTAVDR